MPEKVIALEELVGPFQQILQRVMRLVPDRDRNDKKLQRLIAFRLKIDGESATSEYLAGRVREANRRVYTGSLYSFLKDDLINKERVVEDGHTDPPEVA